MNEQAYSGDNTGRARGAKSADGRPNYGYPELIAASLVLYAAADPDFGAWLKKTASGWPEGEKSGRTARFERAWAELALPSDFETARRRALWIGDRPGKEQDGARAAQAIIKEWQSYKSAPKNLVVGIVGLAIPGVTLGLIKRKRSVALFVRRDLAAVPGLRLAAWAAQAVQGVMAEALILADGDIRRLDPDTAEWYFGEKRIDFYAAAVGSLGRLASEFKSGGLLHTVIGAGGEPAILAAGPAVAAGYLAGYPGLSRIEF